MRAAARLFGIVFFAASVSGCGTTWSDLNPMTWTALNPFRSDEAKRPLEPEAPRLNAARPNQPTSPDGLAGRPGPTPATGDVTGLVGLTREIGVDEHASPQDRVQAATAVERALDGAAVGTPVPWAGDRHSGTVTLVRTGRIPDTGDECRELAAPTMKRRRAVSSDPPEDGSAANAGDPRAAGPEPTSRSVVTCSRDGRWTLVSQ
jgi:hypothetical protein